jgi:adenylosuccinate lyase
VALWHERDISHSSVERIVLPDSCHLAHYVLRRLAGLLEWLEVSADRMRANLEASHGVVFSQPVLLALVAGGLARDEAYRVVQRAAATSWDAGTDFRALLRVDPVVQAAHVDLDTVFDLQRSVRHAGRAVDAASALER